MKQEYWVQGLGLSFSICGVGRRQTSMERCDKASKRLMQPHEAHAGPLWSCPRAYPSSVLSADV